MTTRQSIEAGHYPCRACRGEGREWHGLVDATCSHCFARGLEPCETADCKRPAFRGPLCKTCREAA